MNHPDAKIIAPVCSPAQAREVIDAGADEIYCGAMPASWAQRFGDGDLLSRRQGRQAHAGNLRQLAQIAETAMSAGVPAALTLNSRYTAGQIGPVLELAQAWEDAGGTAVLVCDIGVLLSLAERGSKLQRHLSVMACASNSDSVAFFAGLEVSRVVVPRDLSLGEFRTLVQESPPVEFEALAIYQKCQFMDGMCFFHHGVRIPRDVPAEFDYQTVAGLRLPVVWSHDPAYEGHGCRLNYRSGAGEVRHAPQEDYSAPHCAACQLHALRRFGVNFFKIAGRAFPVAMITRAVRFLRNALSLEEADPDEIRGLYLRVFGRECGEGKCYYRP